MAVTEASQLRSLLYRFDRPRPGRRGALGAAGAGPAAGGAPGAARDRCREALTQPSGRCAYATEDPES